MFHPKGPTFFELARQALSSTERGYDLLAPKFDYTPFRTPAFVLDMVRPVIEAGGPMDRALDVCCGTGAGMEMLRPLCRQVVGFDSSQGMLDAAEERAADWEGDAEVRFIRGDALDPPDLGEPFDVAVCFGALGHILPHDETQFITAIRRQLKQGGRFYFVTSTMPPWWSLRWLISRGFNGAMHVRNFLIKPPFIMFYLTFLIPEIVNKLESAGYRVNLHQAGFKGVLEDYRVVEAIRVD